MAGRSSQSDNRGSDFFGFLVSGKGRQFHSYRDAEYIELVGLTASGGIINDYTDGGKIYRAHIFTSSGTFNVTEIGSFGANVEYLVVAGGGGGAAQGAGAGGGGAGGLRTNLPGVQDAGGNPLTGAGFPVSTSPGSYTVTVGGGGAGGFGPGYGKYGSRGNPSLFTTPITAAGGGGGDAQSSGDAPESTGGSGGGRGGNSPGSAYAGNTPPTSPPQGNPGGVRTANYYAGGGGGAGAAGSDGTPSISGAVGIGVQVAIAGPATSSPVGTPGPSGTGWFAGGGGGGGYPAPGTRSSGGAGGGGDSGHSPSDNGVNATSNTGGGGGGATGDGPTGGAGGSGIVVVRYQMAITSSAKATGGSISFYNDKTIHIFTQSGTFTNTSGSPLSIDYVMVAGGGAGQTDAGGGGGAGGVVTNIPGLMPATNAIPAVGTGSPNALSVVIGAGGATGPGPSNPTASNNGANSTITGPGPISVSATGGGGASATNGPPYGGQPGG